MSDILKKFYIEKDSGFLKKTLSGSSDPRELEMLALLYMREFDFKNAYKIYEKLNFDWGKGRCKLFMKDLDGARKIFLSSNESNPVILWGQSLTQFIDMYVTNIPTFFQIRSFLEVDLDIFIKTQNYLYCENIINGADLMARNNTECYKFIGRVMVNNNLFDMAMIFLEKSKNICYVDPEVHFLIAKCRLANRDLTGARHSLETCLERAPGYFPAQKLLKEITSH